MKKRGFTLLELMTVVVILIILSTVAVISYKKYMARARLEAGYGYVHLLRLREEQYYATYGMYVSSTNSPDDYYPSAYSSGAIPIGEQPWNIDCTAPQDNYAQAFCDLGFNPGATVTFGFVVMGWQPGNNVSPSCVKDTSKPWWLVKAITYGTKPISDTTTIDCYSLRVTSEHPMNVYEVYCEDCDQSCSADKPCCKEDCL